MKKLLLLLLAFPLFFAACSDDKDEVAPTDVKMELSGESNAIEVTAPDVPEEGEELGVKIHSKRVSLRVIL